MSRAETGTSLLVMASAGTHRVKAILDRLRREEPKTKLIVASPRVEGWRYEQEGVENWIIGDVWLHLDPGPNDEELSRRGISTIVLPLGAPRQSLFVLARWLRRLGDCRVRLGASRVQLDANSTLLFAVLAAVSVLWWGPLSITLRLSRSIDGFMLLLWLLMARGLERPTKDSSEPAKGPVCHIIPSLGTGGAQKQLVEYLRSTSGRAVPTRLLLLEDRENLFNEQLEAAAIPSETICRNDRLSRFGRVAAAAFPVSTVGFLLWRRLRKLAPCATMSWLFQANLIAAPAARFAGVPRIVSSVRNLSVWKTWPEYSKWWYRIADRLSAPLNDVVVANSRAVADDYAAFSGMPRSRIEVVVNGIEAPQVDADRARELREGLGIPKNRVLMLTVGRFAAEKNQAMILRCCAQLRSRGHEFALVMVGHGELEASLRELCVRLELDDCTFFPGRSDNVMDWLNAADLFVLSSRIEGLPNVVMEAQACGLAVVATDCGGTAELVEDGRTGLIVPVDDGAAMTEAIERLLLHPDLRLSMGRRGVLRMQRHFNLDLLAQGIDRATLRCHDLK